MSLWRGLILTATHFRITINRFDIHMLSGGTSDKTTKERIEAECGKPFEKDVANLSGKPGTPPLFGTKWRPLRDDG